RGAVLAGGRHCSTECRLRGGRSTDLAATPAAGRTFAGWSGDCHGRGACSLSRGAVTARFMPVPSPDRVAITVLEGGDGSGAVSISTGQRCTRDCVLSVPRGLVIVLTPEPTLGSTFSGWTGCGSSEQCPV